MVSSRIAGTALIVLLALGAGARNASAQQSILNAVKTSNATAVRTLVRQHADVNLAEPDGTTPLHHAVQQNSIDITKLLIEAGANPKAANRYGVTPLSLACVNGNPDIVDALLKAGADPNAALPSGETALMTAARTGVPTVVEALLAHGADVNATEPTHGQTALMWAAGEGHAEAVNVLLAHNADQKLREKAGWTALLFAAREGQADVVRTLVSHGADVNEMLISAGRGRGRAAGAGAISGGGAAPEGRGPAPTPGGPTALSLATMSAHFELGVFLLDHGANANAAGDGSTALHYISTVRKVGQTAVTGPPKGSGDIDSLEFVRRLVAHGANVNARATRRGGGGGGDFNQVGGTPFFFAARTGDAPLMRLLAELGADPLLANEDGTTPLMAAAGVGTHSPGEDPGTEPECLEAVKVALELGNDPNAVDKDGNTAMHGAAYKQLPSVVTYLAQHGAKIEVWNRKNSAGWTPLRIATGVHRGMNFRFSEPTAAALREIMTAARVSTEVEPEAVISGATK
jgi:ankyrin repeat protein